MSTSIISTSNYICSMRSLTEPCEQASSSHFGVGDHDSDTRPDPDASVRALAEATVLLVY